MITTLRRYFYAGSTRVAMRVVDGATNPTYWLLNDHLGSTAITADSSGAKTAELRFKAWGENRFTYGSTPTTYRYTGQREQSQLSISYYGARWYDPALSRFLSPDSVIPDLQNSLDWDRFSYVRNNPLRYIDPTGHVCSDPEDPTPTCEQAGKKKLKKVSYKIDKDILTKGGRRAYELYQKARNNPGWWNNNESGTLTVEQFFGIFVLHEAGGQGPTLPWIKAVSGNRLFLPTPDSFGAKPYCTGDLCRNGMFNFMAAYQGYGKYGETSKLVTRFDTLSDQPLPLPEYRDVSLADAAADVGNDIVSHRSDYQTGDPQSVPYHWGNPSSDPGSPFLVKDARGNLLFKFP